jgi:hypothetical protein
MTWVIAEEICPESSVASYPAGNHHQGKRDRQERAEDIEIGHKGEVEIHRS